MVAFGDGEFTTRGYAPGFVENWLTERLSQGEIVAASTGSLEFSDKFKAEADVS